ncbi:MAG: hypothetical protein EXR28_14445 [Betaproteobacteria bacterium]|nr:hypothetical protein [Betaproteobacteria bacterium]
MVGFPPGGSTDVSARVLAQRLGASLGQPVVVENRAGAGGDLATLAVAGAQPDGHTLLWANSSQVVLPVVFKQDPNFDPLRDLAPLAAGHLEQLRRRACRAVAMVSSSSMPWTSAAIPRTRSTRSTSRR